MSGGAKVGVLVLTHGLAGQGMIDTVTVLLGPAATEGFQALQVAAAEDRCIVSGLVQEAVATLDVGAGVLILCDLSGSTAANCCVDLKRHGGHVEILGGLNLPMLVKLASIDRSASTPTALAKAAAETATRSIRLADGGTP